MRETLGCKLIPACKDGVKAHPAGIYLLKVNNRNIRARCEICSKLTIKTPERRHWCRSGVFILTLNIFHTLF